MIGTTLTHYQITARLGEGGMGEVYRATDTKLGREVAIKVLPASLSRNPQSLARFEREAKALAALNHPHIAGIYGFDADQGTHFLVLELVEGETLAERLRRGPMPLNEALTIARQIAEALQEAHDKGIIHRDLKPGNVKITPGGRVKVLDFGLAKIEETMRRQTGAANDAEAPTIVADSTRPGMVMGTPAYMSPEQARGLDVDKRTDIWAFGCCLFECLSGQKPFRGQTPTDLMAELLKSEPAWAQLPAETPQTVATLLHRCLEKEPRRRLSSIGDIALTLEGLTPRSGAADTRVQPGSRAGLMTILFTDIVGSTQLKQDVGDAEAVRLMQEHHEVVRRILAEFEDAREVETAGDSFLIVFERPSDAVRFSVKLRAKLGELTSKNGTAISDRIGIHLGEVFLEEATSKLFGMQVDTAARIMSLASGGQILMSRLAFDTARQMLRGPGNDTAELQWLNHGPYVMKGIEEPIEVCEVRFRRATDLTGPPPNSEKAHRLVADGELVLGWRPAAGQMVPDTKWLLEEKIGEGAFGEVWLGRHTGLKQKHVFKFCFRADRVRSLKREVTFFRLLKERVGDHPNIVAIHEMYLDSPPYYIEMDYVAGKDLRTWCAAQGGAKQISLEEKLEIVVQAADALQAAHECGIVHRDVKPGNLLISASDSSPDRNAEDKRGARGRVLQCKLSDFGIGQVLSDEYFGELTRIGFTQTLVSNSSLSGTQIYMAPELMAGKPASIRSDIYALGVVLYQLLLGNLDQPLTTDWSQDIADPLLREDLARCFAGRAEDRFSSAAELARSLRTLEQRRAALEREDAAQAARERAAYRRGMIRTGSIATVIVLAMAALAGLAFYQSGLARRAAQLAQAKTKEAQVNADESRERLQRLNVGTGIQRMSEGDLLHALPWFVEGLRLIKNDPIQERVARIRIGTLFAYAPRLLQVLEHPDGVDTGAISPDGTRLLAITSGHTAHLWDLRSGNEVCPPLKHQTPVASGEFSPDGSTVLTLSGEESDSPGANTNALVWSAATGKLLFKLSHASAVRSGAFSPDGKVIATGSTEGVITFWDVATGKSLFLATPAHGTPVLRLIFNSKKAQLITASEDGRVFVRRANDGTPLFAPIEHGSPITTAACSPDGEMIVTAASETVLVWSAQNGRRIGSPIQPGSIQLMAVAFSPDSQRLVTCGYDRSARVWDARTGAAVTGSLQHQHTVSKASFGPDGATLLTASFDGNARLWDAFTGQLLLPSLPHSGTVMDARFLPNGHQVLTFSKDRLVKLWDIAAASPSIPPMAHGGNALLNVSIFSPAGDRVLTASSDGTVALWDAKTATRIHQWTLPAEVLWAEFSRDGTLILTACVDGKARICNAQTGELSQTEFVHEKAVRFASFSKDSALVLTASDDGTAVLWDRSSGQRKVTCRHSAEVNWAQFSPDETRIATASSDKIARVWESSTGKAVTKPLEHERTLVRVAFSPDGKKIVTATSDGTYAACEAQVWDVASGKAEGPSLMHADGVLTAVYSPNGKYIGTSSEDGTAMVWSSQSYKPVAATLKHEHQVHFIEFSPDSAFVLTGSSDFTARVWDLAGEPVTPPLMHYSRVYCGAWHPSGLRIVTGVRLNRAQLWDLIDDKRNIDTLTLNAQVLSGIRIDSLTGPAPVSGSVLAREWKQLAPLSPLRQEQWPLRLVGWHRLQGENARMKKYWSSALFHFDKAIELQSDDATLFWQRSLCHQELQNWDLALSDVNQAIALDPGKAYLHEHRANLLRVSPSRSPQPQL